MSSLCTEGKASIPLLSLPPFPFMLTPLLLLHSSGVSAGWGAGGLRGQGAPAGIELCLYICFHVFFLPEYPGLCSDYHGNGAADRSTWQYVYPNRILDRQFGFLWEQQLNLADLALSFQNKINAVECHVHEEFVFFFFCGMSFRITINTIKCGALQENV